MPPQDPTGSIIQPDFSSHLFPPGFGRLPPPACAGVGPRSYALRARSRPPFPPLGEDVSALTGCDRFCNRIAAVKPLFLLCLASQVDPNRSLVAGNRDGEKCSRAVIEPGTASDGIRGKLSFVGALWVPEVCQKRRHRPHHHGGRQLPNRLTVSGVPSQGDGQVFH